MDGTEYITLKEAGEISGYSPDYIGQLIRRGKITGKQVYANVAWVTTREAISEYLSEKGKSKNIGQSDDSLTGQSIPSPLPSPQSPSISQLHTEEQSIGHERYERLFQLASRVIMIGAILFLVFLFHVLSTLLDDRLERRALERMSAEHSFSTL